VFDMDDLDLKEAMWPIVKEAREMSVLTPRGSIFLDAAASAAGCSSDGVGNLMDAEGHPMTERHPDYEWIIRMAKRQAVIESPIGREILDG